MKWEEPPGPVGRKTHCIRGHDIALVGRTALSGNCKACARERKRQHNGSREGTRARYIESHPEADALFGRFASEVLGDFYKLEEHDPSWTQPPHPYDPNRLCGWPVNGFGWPADEYLCRLVADYLAQAKRDLQAGYQPPKRRRTRPAHLDAVTS